MPYNRGKTPGSLLPSGLKHIEVNKMQIITGSTGDGTGASIMNNSLNITPEAVIFAVLTLVLGYIIAKIIVRWTKRVLRRQGHMTEVAAGLLGRIISILLYIIVILIA